MCIIGLSGLIGSGKDTVADILVSENGFKKLSFADRLKDGISTVFGYDRAMIAGETAESRSWRDQPDEYWSAELGFEITPRYVMQNFGTECMRGGFYDGIWTSIVKKEILEDPDADWVVPDCRFINEAVMLSSIGAQLWWVKRGKIPEWFTAYRERGIAPTNGVHKSEWEWGNTQFDVEIMNNGTLAELHQQISYQISQR